VFAAMRHRDFRLFLIGQFVSLCGTWMQTVAQGWLVFRLTNSAFAVGLVTALGSLPILVFTLYGGVVADRVNRRRFVLVLQGFKLAEALALAVLTHLGLITVPLIMVLAVFAGLASAFEVPARQAMLSEMVDRADLMNAIALNSSAFHAARVVGPAVAGGLIGTVGIAACFYANAASYLAVIVALAVMHASTPRHPGGGAGVLEAFREGFAYVFGNRWPRALVVIVATFSIFGFSFVTMMPVFAHDTLRLTAAGYGALVSAIGVGATAGALFMAAVAARARRARLVLGSSLLFGAVLTAAAFSPTFPAAVVLFGATGCFMALNGIAANTMLQSEAPDHLRGRVMGFYSFLVLGVAPFGALQAGWVAEHLGVRAALGAGGGVCLLVAAGVTLVMRSTRPAWSRPAHPKLRPPLP
jgi:MFS family permease